MPPESTSTFRSSPAPCAQGESWGEGRSARGVRPSAHGPGVRAHNNNPPLILLETTINSRPITLEIEPRAILLDVLRDDLGLTGAKCSCDTQVCGACTVLLDGSPVSACCTLAYEAGGREIETIEGLAGPHGLHPIQQAFVDRVAIQCGFCTPGFVLATKALLTENPRPTRTEIEDFLGGNLCRCTGYWNILDAVVDAVERLASADGRSEAP